MESVTERNEDAHWFSTILGSVSLSLERRDETFTERNSMETHSWSRRKRGRPNGMHAHTWTAASPMNDEPSRSTVRVNLRHVPRYNRFVALFYAFPSRRSYDMIMGLTLTLTRCKESTRATALTQHSYRVISRIPNDTTTTKGILYSIQSRRRETRVIQYCTVRRKRPKN